MGRRNWLTKILALAGTLAVWLVLLVPVFFSAVYFLRSSKLRFDWLMPAELSLVAFVGGAMLLWSALRVKTHRAVIAGGLLAAILSLVGGQAYAVFSGLASGEIDAEGLPWMIVLASLGIYVLGVLVVGWGGIRLLTVLLQKQAKAQNEPG